MALAVRLPDRRTLQFFPYVSSQKTHLLKRETPMKIAYLDCLSGISGDMTLGALVDIGIPLETIQAGIDSLGLPS